eukprot:8706-Heterococcus_DN1.PRE.1
MCTPDFAESASLCDLDPVRAVSSFAVSTVFERPVCLSLIIIFKLTSAALATALSCYVLARSALLETVSGTTLLLLTARSAQADVRSAQATLTAATACIAGLAEFGYLLRSAHQRAPPSTTSASATAALSCAVCSA